MIEQQREALWPRTRAAIKAVLLWSPDISDRVFTRAYPCLLAADLILFLALHNHWIRSSWSGFGHVINGASGGVLGFWIAQRIKRKRSNSLGREG